MNEPATGHPDVDTLSDLDEGLLAGTPAEAAAQSHVAGCASCADFIALLASTREQLGALPATPMPADVVARIDAALAGEAARRAAPDAALNVAPDAEPAPQPAAVVTSLDSARRSRAPRWMRASGAVAAGIALLMAGAIGYGALTTVTEKSGTISSAEGGNSAPNGAGAARDALTKNYTQATLAAGVRALVDNRTAAAIAPQTKSVSPMPLGAQQDRVGPPDLDRLRAPAQLAACITELASRPGVAPLAVDYATYEGQPAVIIVLPDADPTAVQAWVVGPACSTGNPDIRHREVVVRAG